MNTRCLILANGDPPNQVDLHYLQKSGFNYLFCADGGVNSAYELKIVPDTIVGDLDSANDEVLEYYKGKSEIVYFSRQDDTDVEKALKLAISRGFREAILLGATGDRLDHTFCNLGITLKFFDHIKIYILHQRSVLEVKTGDFEIGTIPGETISLYGFDQQTLISTEGMKYPLKNESLQFGVRESTSNEAIGEKIKISVKNGKIFMIREFRAVKENDYFIEH